MISTKALSGVPVIESAKDAGRSTAPAYNGLKKLMSSVAGASWFVSYSDESCMMSTNRSAVALSADLQRFREVERQTARLWSMAYVEDGWDGGEAKAPSRESLLAAHGLLNVIGCNQYIPIPIASVNSSGQSNLFWDFDGFYADVDVDEDKVEFFVKRDDQDQGAYHEEPLSRGQIPPTLLTSLLYKYFNAKSESMP